MAEYKRDITKEWKNIGENERKIKERVRWEEAYGYGEDGSESRHLGEKSPLEAIFAQDKTQRELEKHSGNHPDKVSLLKSQCNLQEGRHYS